MTADEIEALPRGTTVVFFPVAALEDHGPHLPVGLKLDEAEALCRMAAERLEAENKGWTGVIAPRAPIGVETLTSSWAFSVRGYVMRDYLVDLGWTWLRQGFRFLVCFSGSPTARQRTAVEEAGRILSSRARAARGRILEFFKGSGEGMPSLVSAQSGDSLPKDIWPSLLGADPVEHGGRRDTSMALWLYQDSPREPKVMPAEALRTGTPLARFWLKRKNKLWGYWGDPSKASPTLGSDLLSDQLGAFFPRLNAWITGANPTRVFSSWEALLPSNRTTFKVWLLGGAIFLLVLMYLKAGLLGGVPSPTE
jgi:creatinine amidohydrolase/Fe(II)-dependent formamide hydrolase-like protein